MADLRKNGEMKDGGMLMETGLRHLFRS